LTLTLPSLFYYSNVIKFAARHALCSLSSLNARSV